MFMNSGFIGYPLVLVLFGYSALKIAILYNTVNAVLIFSLGVYIIGQKKDPWQLFKIPFVYAALIGLIFSYLKIGLPVLLASPIELIGKATIPLALALLGLRLLETKIKSWLMPFLAALLRLGLGYGLASLAIFFLPFEALTAKTILLLSLLPSGITPIALAEEYQTDRDLVASSIVMSSLLALVALPLIIKFLLGQPSLTIP